MVLVNFASLWTCNLQHSAMLMTYFPLCMHAIATIRSAPKLLSATTLLPGCYTSMEKLCCTCCISWRSCGNRGASQITGVPLAFWLTLIQSICTEWARKKHCHKRDLESFLGHLCHAARVVCEGEPFFGICFLSFLRLALHWKGCLQRAWLSLELNVFMWLTKSRQSALRRKWGAFIISLGQHIRIRRDGWSTKYSGPCPAVEEAVGT